MGTITPKQKPRPQLAEEALSPADAADEEEARLEAEADAARQRAEDIPAETINSELSQPPNPASVPRVQASRRRDDMIDRSRARDIGIVTPPAPTLDPDRFAHLFQPGPSGEPRYFDKDGRRVRMPGDDEREAEAAVERQRTALQRAKRLREQAEALERGEEPETPDEDVKEGEINLTEFALFRRNYDFREVRKAIQTRFNIVVKDEEQAIDVLIDQKVVTQQQFNIAARALSRTGGRRRAA